MDLIRLRRLQNKLPVKILICFMIISLLLPTTPGMGFSTPAYANESGDSSSISSDSGSASASDSNGDSDSGGSSGSSSSDSNIFKEMPDGGDNNNVADPAGEDNDSGDLADGDIDINGPDEENISVEDPTDENTGAVILIPDEENTSVVIPDEENINDDNNPDDWFIIIDDNVADTTGDYFPILPLSDISPMTLAGWVWSYNTGSNYSPVVDADYENDITYRFEASISQTLQGLSASHIAQYVSLNGTDGGSFNSTSGFSGGLVPAAWITSIAARNFVITIPADRLNPSTTYEIIISKEFLDKNGDTGNNDKDYQLLFSTKAEIIDPNAISPVFSNIPVKGYVGFDPDDSILISFDEAIDPNSISGSSDSDKIKLVRNFISGEGSGGQDTAVPFTLSWNEDNTLLTVKPNTALESGLAHTISVLSGLETVSGKTIKPTEVSFTTLAFSIVEIFNDYYNRSDNAYEVGFKIKNNTTKYAKDFYGRVEVRGGQEAGEESGGDVLAVVDFGPVTVDMNAIKEITVPVAFPADKVIADDKIYLDIYIYNDANHKYYFAKPGHGTVEVKDFQEDAAWNLTVEDAVKIGDEANNYRWDNLIDYKISNTFYFKSDINGVFAHLSDESADPAALTEAKSTITLNDEVVDPESVTFGRNEIVVTIPARQLTYSADYKLKVGKELKAINNKECASVLDTVLFLTTRERDTFNPLVGTYDELITAIEAIESDIDVIEITADITLTAPVTIPAGKEITIRSAAGATRTLSMSEEAANNTKHFLYEAPGSDKTHGGVLKLQDIVLKGVKKGAENAYTGGSGGVRMDANTRATLIMNGGAVIEDCFNSEQQNGGGVAIKKDSYGTLVMNDGATIQNCYSTVVNASGGVALLTDSYATFIMNGGAVIKDCYSGATFSSAGGVMVGRTSEFTMNGGEISGNMGIIGGINIYSGTFTINGGKISGNKGTNTGGVYVSSTTFTMNGGKISGNTGTTSGSGGVFVFSGTFTMNSGEISGNTSSNGAGVYNSGTFIMGDPDSGAAIPVIRDNMSTSTSSGYGGGVYVDSGTFAMNCGEISGNTARIGGGVYVGSARTFMMNGGKISGNTAVDNGGGVYVTANGKFTMNDSEISGNEAEANGGGVYTGDESYGNLTIGGQAVFSGNKAGTAYAPPADAAAAYQNIQFISTSIAAHPLNNYDIGYTGSTVYKSKLIYDTNGGDGAVIEIGIDAPFEATLLTAAAAGFSREGYQLAGWNTEAEGTGTSYASGAVISATHDITLYAIWHSPTDAQLPVLSAHPQNATANVGGSVTLSVTASVTDGGTLSYQWYSNTTDSNSGGTEITGATDSTYTAPTSLAGTAYYYVVVTNSNDSATGSKTATATSDAAAVTVNLAFSGAGTADSPLEIGTPDELAEFKNVWNAGTLRNSLGLSANAVVSIKLTADIDLSSHDNWTPIGTPSRPFGGVFNGQGNTITGLKITDQIGNAGLFGYVEGYDNWDGYRAQILNLNVENCSIVSTGISVGGIAGSLNDATIIENCSVSGSIRGDSQVGGIVGYARFTNYIRNSSNLASVSGGNYIGGMIGYSRDTQLKDCHNTGSISGDSYIGGIVGQTSYGGNDVVNNCYNNGDITGTGNNVGGIAGSNNLSSTGSPIEYCYNTGNVVSSGSNVGGIVGDMANKQLRYCYNSGNISGNGYVGGIAGKNNNSYILCASYSTGDVTGSGDYVGGIIGYGDRGTVAGCYSLGSVSGAGNYVGGVAGCYGTSQGEIQDCGVLNLSVSSTAGGANCGRISGANGGSGKNNFAWDGIPGLWNNVGADNLDGESKTAEQLKTASTWFGFTNSQYSYINSEFSYTAGSLPILKNTGGVQSSDMPWYLRYSTTDAEEPAISAHPQDATANVGDSVTLSVTASVADGGTLSYQWYSNTTESNTGGTEITGAIDLTYAADTSLAGTTYYYVVVTNSNDNATGNKTATATSDAAAVTVNVSSETFDAEEPVINTHPQGATVNVGDSVTLSVSASVTDGGTLSYQWYSNTTDSNTGGTEITGATVSTYAADTSSAGTTYYYVVVTNSNDSATGSKTATATSNASTVTVNDSGVAINAEEPVISARPQDATANVGDSVTLSATASVADGGILSYQWYSNTTESNTGGTEITGATDSTYAADTSSAGTTYYYVVVTNSNYNATGNKTATATSDAAAVTVTSNSGGGRGGSSSSGTKTTNDTTDSTAVEIEESDTPLTDIETNESDRPLVNAGTKSKYFSDVDENWSWAVAEIDYLYENGIVNGLEDGSFAPAMDISRGDFMLMLVRAFALQAAIEENFSDVPADSYYYEAVGIAKALGITEGDGVNFYPEAPITRQDMITLIDRTLQSLNKALLKGTDADLSAFADSNQIADYAKTSVATLVQSGIINGTESGINPLGNTTRAEMAVVLYRILTM